MAASEQSKEGEKRDQARKTANDVHEPDDGCAVFVFVCVCILVLVFQFL